MFTEGQVLIDSYLTKVGGAGLEPMTSYLIIKSQGAVTYYGNERYISAKKDL